SADGTLVTSLADVSLGGHALLDVSRIAGAGGKWSIDADGKFTGDEIAVKKATVEAGITTRDRATGEYYCMYVSSGTTVTAPGSCPDYSGPSLTSAAASSTEPLPLTEASEPAAGGSIAPYIGGETGTTTDTAVTVDATTATTTESSPANISEGNVGGQAATTTESAIDTSTEPAETTSTEATEETATSTPSTP
ncbi:MAG: hypothetical protein Q8Q36_00975, partial [bacterium]|nr:hypothetical protein [bacterium]